MPLYPFALARRGESLPDSTTILVAAEANMQLLARGARLRGPPWAIISREAGSRPLLNYCELVSSVPKWLGYSK